MPKRKKDNERWQAYLDGELTTADMDEEELKRGRFRDKGGGFRGRLPATVPRDFGQQLSRELMMRGDSEFKTDFLKAIRHLRYLAFNADKDDTQLKATLAWIERLMGKTPERVILSPGRPEWEGAVDDFVTVLEDEEILRAKEILGKLSPEQAQIRELKRQLAEARRNQPPMIDGTSRRVEDPFTDESQFTEDEELTRQFLDEELASEYLDESDTA
jgi:hypothetical protein